MRKDEFKLFQFSKDELEGRKMLWEVELIVHVLVVLVVVVVHVREVDWIRMVQLHQVIQQSNLWHLHLKAQTTLIYKQTSTG